MIAVEVLGWVSAVSLLIAYALLTTGRAAASGWAYLALNLVGSGGLAVNGIVHTAWPSAALNLLWLAVAIGATRAANAATATPPKEPGPGAVAGVVGRRRRGHLPDVAAGDR